MSDYLDDLLIRLNLKEVPPPPPPTFFGRFKSFFGGPTMDSSFRGIMDLGVRLCLVCVSAYISARILAAVLDPDAENKKRSKKTADAVMKELGIQDSKVKLTEHEILMAAQLVSTSESENCWSEIGGQEELIQEIRDTLILPLRLTKLKKSTLVAPPKGVLLYGPPGCGKTMIAKALAKATGARFMNIQISELTDKWYGESQKRVAALFSLAKKIQPVIIFIDEIDAFLRARNSFDHECTAMMKAQFMSLWDGFVTDPTARVIIVGATNRATDVDPAILRRMPARFHVKKPNPRQRLCILEVILRNEKLSADIDLAAIAEMTNGFSGSDLREVCRIAALHRIKDMMAREETKTDQEQEEDRPFQSHELFDAVEKIKQTQILDTWTTAGLSFAP